MILRGESVKKKKMSWPTVWQSPNQTPVNAAQTQLNMAMFTQLTPEQQIVMQQQNWQQWQLFQQQYTQWQAQYGAQVNSHNNSFCIVSR